MARRLLLELRRLAYGDRKVVSRGPTVLSHSLSRHPGRQQHRHNDEGHISSGGGSGGALTLTLKMSSASLTVQAGILVGCKQCVAQQWNTNRTAPGKSCHTECRSVHGVHPSAPSLRMPCSQLVFFFSLRNIASSFKLCA